jgi:flagellar biosynthesis protein FlhF
VTIKTYRGKTIADALAQVKKDLGKDAVILHTRTYKAGGVLGLGAHTMTEITATDTLTAGSVPARPRLRAVPPAAPAVPLDCIPDSTPRRTPDPLIVSPVVPAASEIRSAALGDNSVPGSLRDELAAIKRLVGQVLQSSRGSRPVGVSDALFDCYLKLVQSEVASEIADDIVAGVRDELRGSELIDPEIVRSAVLRRLAAYIPVATTARSERPADGRPLTVALVGPTGVGKTTTIAKLAATYKLRRGKRVGLVTSDTYRIAAVDQLRTYANIIGLNLKVAMSPAEMRQACESLSDCDVVLIDTAGRSPQDGARLSELERIIAAASPHETHLVLSSAAGESSMRSAVERFAHIRPNHVIFTKLDEAVSFGTLINIATRVNASLSYVTTGQEVPDQIESGDPQRLARLVLEGPLPASSVIGSGVAEGGSA